MLMKMDEIQKGVHERETDEITKTNNMVLSGKRVVALGLVKNMIDHKSQVQPAGIDFTLKRLSTLESDGAIDFSNAKRKLPEYKEVLFGDDNLVHLGPGAYLVEFNETVEMPRNFLGLMRTRSSVIRSGATLTAGVIDPGYKGAIGALLQVWNEHGITLHKDAKLVQWVFAEIRNPEDEYRGVYKDSDRIF